MFTGLVAATGSVVSLTPSTGATRLLIAAPALKGRWHEGDSIAVNGVCLTAICVEDELRFGADLAAETLTRTTLGALLAGSVVNLELPTPAGSPLGGHVVQGHVDGTGFLEMMVPVHPDLATTDWRMTIEAPIKLARHIIPQGSITVNGISLTVAKVHTSAPDRGIRFDIAIIPHTYAATNLHTLSWGSPVNIETDVLAKYAAQQKQGEVDWLTVSYMLANGY